MKTEKNIFIAFILNLAFSIFEFFGGIYTGSISVLSDSVHDLGDALSTGASFFLEKYSKKAPDSTHTYGYARYSLIGAAITSIILVISSAAVIYGAIIRIINPVQIKYDEMIIFAVAGICVNGYAAFVTREKSSLAQKAVNLHMLEDVLGWAVVLAGAIIMKFTSITIIDPIMSIFVAAFILINSLSNLKEITDIFVCKTPSGIDIESIRENLEKIDNVADIHHIHISGFDGNSSIASMHVVADRGFTEIKDRIRTELLKHGITHVTLEFESTSEICCDKDCHILPCDNEEHHHNHHHHHHHHNHKHKH